MKTLYTAEVSATGGRSGQVKSSDGIIDMAVNVPEGLGGKKGSTNPEQLFAAGYAACFQSALLLVAGKQKIRLEPDSTVTAHVSLLQLDNESYGLGVKLVVDVKGLDHDQAVKLVNQAHEVCPYSVGTRGNIDVQLEVV
ncbi:organic hydroperoxide resistance protein [Adhaeribacter pallidiroseus]|uniref:Organic hydroperoxide resistance protein OhrB n=1 Tax=Adhaeribacter pallidiroseus TaxID=2072847 RepID=A0A369QBF5_9BACT|nr:organic hydroperoxide resistance protein [Adhaeribacter pallidiroseus]RDC62253.1 Organic hydroperoxide resistance protein OhrB [Adhaeribacter pallidiroseus]